VNIMPITDAMRARHVVRQYLSTPLPDDVVAALRSRIEDNNRAHGTDIRLVTGDARVFGPLWGTVRARSVRNCLIMSGPDAPDLDERLGYGGADLMLAAQDLGLNTWWIGGTFSKRAAARGSGGAIGCSREAVRAIRLCRSAPPTHNCRTISGDCQYRYFTHNKTLGIQNSTEES